MSTSKFVGLCCLTVCFQLALSCPAKKYPRQKGERAYLSDCAQVEPHVEQWTVKIDVGLRPGKFFQDNSGWTLPTPQEGFWLKSAYVAVVDEAETKRFMWPPIHVHHIVCRTSRADAWYNQEVFDHPELFLSGAGALFMNDHLQRYDVFNGSDGWAAYHPARTRVRCGIRIDDDRLYGQPQQYRLVITLNVILDADRHFDFRPCSPILLEGTTTGQIGYNAPAGHLTVLSTEYHAPRSGSFQPDRLDSHTHPGGKSFELFANRLGGQDLVTPQRLLTLRHRSMIVEEGLQSQTLNVKPGVYMRRPTTEWSEMGLSWLNGNLSTIGVRSKIPCAFQEGDIFYLKALHHAEKFMRNDMMTLGGVVLWNEQPRSPTVSSRPLQNAKGSKEGSFLYSGTIRNQLFGQFFVPHDLLAEVPQRVNQSVLYELHSRLPLLFCHPDRVADVKYVKCLRKVNDRALHGVPSVKDLDQHALARRQNHC